MQPLDVVFALLMVALLIDWRQTLIIASNPDKWVELNPILGPHPSRKKVSLYFAAVIIIAVAMYVALVPLSRSADALVVVTLIAVIQWAVVVRNHRLGIK